MELSIRLGLVQGTISQNPGSWTAVVRFHGMLQEG